MKQLYKAFAIVASLSLLLGACATPQAAPPQVKEKAAQQVAGTSENTQVDVHEGINQPPTPLIVKRTGENEVYIEMTAQITEQEIAKGVTYKTWNFNGTAPGPVVRVKEGDTITFKLKNMDPKIPHSMDFHAVHAAPSVDFANVEPNGEGVFTYKANTPGVFMYHCGTAPVLQHIANGMYGTIIVEPKNGYPTDGEIDREFILIQSEFYKENDWNDMIEGEPDYVVFNGKHTNISEPFYAKVGDKIRIIFNNVGPNEISSFHVVGTTFDTVYVDGNPNNVLKGLQAYSVPASGGLIAEFRVVKEGVYPIVTHQFNHASKGAVAKLIVTKDGKPDPNMQNAAH